MSQEHGEHHPNYLLIFGALCVLTLGSVLADAMMTGNRGLLIFSVMAIACFKASFVMLYFMHLKFEGKWKFVLLGPTMVLALALPFTLAPDISLHYYDVDVPQHRWFQSAEADHHAQPSPHHSHHE